MSAKEHQRLFKNAALNPEELRRRREETGIQLRKQKREEQVNLYFLLKAANQCLCPLVQFSKFLNPMESHMWHLNAL